MAASQEIIDAINGTVVSNNVKGITADSLRNLLLLMAETLGGSGGSGEGALRVMMPLGIFLVEEGAATEFDFTPEIMAEVVAEIPEFAEVGEEMFAHNAKVYAQLMEKVNACEGVSVIADASKFYKTYLGFIASLEGAEVYGMALSEPVIVQAIDSTLKGMSTQIGFYAINKETSLLAPYDYALLNEDGSLKFVIIQEETTEPTE